MNNYNFFITEAGTRPIHINHKVIGKTWLLMRESVHWINMNANIESVGEQCATWLEYQHTQPKERHYIMKYYAHEGK